MLDLCYVPFLEHLPASVHPEWEALARSVFDRALGHRDAVHDGDLVEVRRDLLQQELDGLEAGYLDAFGWPWFDEQDLTRWWDFVGRPVVATGEAAAIADARERQDEDPIPEEPLAMSPAMVVAVPEDVAEQLWRHGEDELAVRMLDVDEATWGKVMVTAASPPEQVRRQGRGTVDEALVHAAVEVLTGVPRPLARKRRRPAGRLATSWARVGPERDLRRRAEADRPLRTGCGDGCRSAVLPCRHDARARAPRRTPPARGRERAGLARSPGPRRRRAGLARSPHRGRVRRAQPFVPSSRRARRSSSRRNSGSSSGATGRADGRGGRGALACGRSEPRPGAVAARMSRTTTTTAIRSTIRYSTSHPLVPVQRTSAAILGMLRGHPPDIARTGRAPSTPWTGS